MTHLLVAGYGYSSEAVVAGLGPDWHVTATARTADKARRITSGAVRGIVFDGARPSDDFAAALQQATHLLISIPPDAQGDPLLRWHEADIRSAPTLGWIGYLSTVGVYGDHGGGWVDEATPVTPGQTRSIWRAEAERAWLALAASRETPVQLFRLGGIYGPGRNQVQALREGTQRRIVKPGQVFNRIHVDDIGSLVRAGIARPGSGPVLHGVDDEPCPPQDVVVYAAGLLGIEPPPEVPVEAAGLSPMGLSFYSENKRISNARTKAETGWVLRYPTYREGLKGAVGSRQ